MKILHTGDWHIGKLVHGIHMTEDQRYILNGLIALIDQEKPDVLVIAGDIYDRSIPPVEAVELLDETLSTILMAYKIPVIAIAGNHDSPDRLGFASKIMKDNGLFIKGKLEIEPTPIVLEDEFGPVHFYVVPYTEPAVVRHQLKEESIKDHDSAMKAILDRIECTMDKAVRNVCVTHGFITGTESLETSESERPLSIGGTDVVNVDYFKGFDYTALGHLHRPQKVKSDRVRYSGSLMKYSFSEAMQKKSVTLVEMDGKGTVEVEQIELTKLRDMRVIKGELENLLDEQVYGEANTDDYIMAILTDRGELLDPISKLRAVYPNILKLERAHYERIAGEDRTSAGGEFINKNPLELFKEFFESTTGDTFDADKTEIINGIMATIEKDRRLL